MLKGIRTYWGSGLILAIVILVVLATTYDNVFSKYRAHINKKTPEASQYHVVAEPLSKAFLDWTDDHAGAVSALATVAVAGLTWALVIVTGRQARLTQATIDLARDEFNAAHLPRLRVRKAVVPPFSATFANCSVGPKDVLEGSLDISNVGDATAQILLVSYVIYLGKRHYTDVPKNFRNATAVDVMMPQGFSSITVPLKGIIRDEPQYGAFQDSFIGRETHLAGDWNLYVMGEVIYRDLTVGHVRTTGFCREFRRDGVFRAVKNPDYEYED